MAENAKALESLSNVDIFSSLGKQELAALSRIATLQQHQPGNLVFRQGDKSDSFQVVLSGAFEVYLWDDILKIERSVAVMKRGELFGEMGILTDENRSAFVRARESGETLCFEKEGFYTLLGQHPKMLFALAKTLAHRLNAANKARGLKLDNLASYTITKDLVALLPLQLILRHKVLPVARDGTKVTVAVVDPSDLIGRNTAADFLRQHQVTWICVSQPDFESFRDKKLFDLVPTPAPLEAIEEDFLTYVGTNLSSNAETGSPAARMLDDILKAAIEAGASDLHLEPSTENIKVRARIDGRMVELTPPLPHQVFRSIVSRIKVLSDLDLTETRLPQDAALRLLYGKRQIDLRISTVPTPRGESVVSRLFDPHQRQLLLADLVVSEPLHDLVRQLFLFPSGLLLVTGPTGSGKTTTLYAGLQTRLREMPTNKLVTAEDPIEYELPGATQVQVKPHVGLTYDRILRSLLRQDPDVILVGEMRDKASVEIAMEAALTGHFVLSSLHTTDALETVMRLRQRGVEEFVISSALRGVISQRLLPRLCELCRKDRPANKSIQQKLRASGLAGPKQSISLSVGQGCDHCRMTGFKGRIGAYEILVMTPALQEAIENEASLAQMQKATSPSSYVSMRTYARFLLEHGLVCAEDVLAMFPAATAKTKLSR